MKYDISKLSIKVLRRRGSDSVVNEVTLPMTINYKYNNHNVQLVAMPAAIVRDEQLSKLAGKQIEPWMHGAILTVSPGIQGASVVPDSVMKMLVIWVWDTRKIVDVIKLSKDAELPSKGNAKDNGQPLIGKNLTDIANKMLDDSVSKVAAYFDKLHKK